VYMMSHHQDKSVADLWSTADPEIEDVMNGICISLLLPNIKCLDVKLGTIYIICFYACYHTPEYIYIYICL
jgi:hypothetical protein